MALWDAIVRVLIGALLITLAVELKGIFTLALPVGLILIFTAIIGFCPIYKLIGFGSEVKTEES